jgi:hypothetical protein
MSTKDVTDKMVCDAYAEMHRQRDQGRGKPWADYEFPYVILMRMTGECEKVCYRAMQRACDRNLIEYGVSLRTGWLTDKGLALIKESEK